MSAAERLTNAVNDLIRERSEERVRQAYEHGYQAGLKAQEADRITYRRGYLAGYHAAQRGTPAYPDGAPNGRERFETVGG